ncbi:hypothetical protein GCM10027416_20920 [Okibacterium endophyticum]
MKHWRFAFNRRWLGYLGVAVVFAVVCVFLSTWQLGRSEQRQDEADLVSKNFESQPVPIDDVLPELDSWDDEDAWLPVVVSGEYLVDEQLLVRNRPRNGQPGFEVLTPLLRQDGSVFIVDRGWVPTGNEQDEPDDVPAPPSGQVEVVARLKAGEPTLPGRGASEGQIATIQLDEIAQRLDAPTYSGAYGLMHSESPAAADPRPAAAIKPEPNVGLHLSYAFQWVVFALMGFVFLGYAIRQEYRIANSEEPEERERAAERERKRTIKRTDADIEDEIVEAAGRGGV